MLLVLFLIFLVLKLTGLVMWSWWLVFAPLLAIAVGWILGLIVALLEAMYGS